MPATNVTLTAQWTAISYTVTYAHGGGTGTLPTQANRTIGQTFSVSVGTALTNGTDVFNGWSDGTTNYSAGDSYTMPASNVTLTARWSAAAPTNYTITYGTTNSDGGNAPANTTGNGSVTLRSNSGNLTRSGYTFGGWNTGTGCSGTNYAANASYTLGANITLYPCWNLISPPPSDPEPTPEPELKPKNNVGAKVKPVVVWKNPNAIKTTTVLSATQLNAVATTSSSVTSAIANPAMPDKLPSTAPTIAGKYVYTPIVTTVVTAGVNQVTTITSAANALTGTTKTIETTTTPSIPNNTTSTTNIEEKPVLGQGTSLAPGLQKMKVVFIPIDSTTYEPVESEVEILVQAETKVEWVEPAPIKKNTPVGPAQLNATGSAPGISNNVPGTYKYDIPEGQTFAPGKYPVKVIFTPTDPNYLPSETTTTITVIADINPLATPIVTPSNTPAAKPITNTTSGAKTTILSIGSGLSSAATSGTQVSVLPISTFSGKTSVRVAVTDEGETKEVDVPVTVLPLPAVAPVATPNTKGQSTINWKPSVNAIQYEVTLAGKTICTTNATSCSTNALIGPKSEVIVIAKGNDETVSPVAPAKYTAPKKPVTALVVYFDTNKFNLDAKDKADIRAVAKIIIEQGFKNIVVNGHTDIRGGVDNQVLSRNRSNSTFDYLKSLVPGLNVTIGAFASTKPAVKGSSAAALASNRRAEVGVF
jgi:outer membrane protein OmpA-like peptidoglycan-associated protein